MRSKLTIFVIAVFLGVVASFSVNSYITNTKSKLEADTKPVKVLTTAEAVPMGLTLEEMKARKMLLAKKVPREFAASGALSVKDDPGEKVLAYSLERGEQLTKAKFKTPKQAGLAYMIPKNYVAISIPVDDVKGVSGMIKIGDYINVIATFDKDKAAVTQTLLQKVKVLAVGTKIERDTQSPSGIDKALASENQQPVEVAKKTITLALSPSDAEKLVFSEEQGQVWLTLMASPEAQPVSTGGQTLETVFK